MFVHNFIKLSAAVHECSRRKMYCEVYLMMRIK